MKLKSIYFIIISVLIISFASCLRDSDTELSSNPYFVSLSFFANDSIEGLDEAVFTLELDESPSSLINTDSVIVNLDSLPFQTRIDSVWPSFTFESTYFTALFQEKERGVLDTIYLGGNSSSTKNDTINFDYPTWVQNFSADGTAERTYRVQVNVHQVEPELYVWEKLKDQITANATTNQKAILFDDKYLFYIGSETQNLLYETAGTSLSSESVWSSENLNFPDNETSLKFRHMIINKGTTIFVTDNENKLYMSGDGKEWEKVNYQLSIAGEIHNLLFSLNDSLWAITKSNAINEYRIAYSTNGEQWTDWGKLPEKDSGKFPISDYSALVFKSATGNPKVLIVGGYGEDGTIIQANWIGQINSTTKIFVLEPLKSDELSQVQDAALIQYDKKILLFGGMYDGKIIPLLESENEGFSWAVPDSAYNMLPDDFPQRFYQSVIVNNDKRIYLFGGKVDGTGYLYSDVWTSKLNRLYWDD